MLNQQISVIRSVFYKKYYLNLLLIVALIFLIGCSISLISLIIYFCWKRKKYITLTFEKHELNEENPITNLNLPAPVGPPPSKSYEKINDLENIYEI